MREKVGNLVLKALGVLLVGAAVLKGYEVLTVPMADSDIWSNRWFMIFQVEFELGLGIWLLSGLFRRGAWLAGIGCFCLFCCVTLYKGLAGFGSCGCFGTVHVSPWVTLFAVDVPAVFALFFVRPDNFLNEIGISASSICRGIAAGGGIGGLRGPVSWRAMLVGSFTILSVITSSIVLAVNEPALVTSAYEVLEPETWIGKELPILEHIDIGEQLAEGNWLIVLYHHDCPSCAEAIPKIEAMARDMKGNEDFLRFALIEVPPYGLQGSSLTSKDSYCTVGKLDMSKEWFVTSKVSSKCILRGSLKS